MKVQEAIRAPSVYSTAVLNHAKGTQPPRQCRCGQTLVKLEIELIITRPSLMNPKVHKSVSKLKKYVLALAPKVQKGQNQNNFRKIKFLQNSFTFDLK